MKKDFLAASILILVAVFSRLISHDWNFTAMGAMAVVAGLLISHRLLALLVPVMALLISDAVIGFHNVMLAVYLGYVLMVVAGVLFSKSQKIVSVVSASLVGSLAFFLVSNLGVWFEGQLYPRTFSGLMWCFEMAVPFFRNEVVSNILVTPVLFLGLSYLGLRTTSAEAKYLYN